MEFQLIETNKGRPCLLYDFNKFRKCRFLSNGQISWRCCVGKCKASVKTDAQVASITEENSNHNHAGKTQHDLQRQILRVRCKRKAREDVTMQPGKLIKHELLLTNEDTPATICKELTSVRKAIYRERRKKLPAFSKSRQALKQQQISTSIMKRHSSPVVEIASTKSIMSAASVFPPPFELLKPISVPKKLLLGAGPANASQRISEASALPLLGHLHPEFLQLMQETRAGIKYAFQTKNDYTFAISGTGHAAMEAALCNVLEHGESIVIVVNGAWGERAADMAERCGSEVHKIQVNPGEVAKLEDVKQALEKFSPSALFVCHGESSTGVVHPLEGLGSLCKTHKCILIVDCVASLGGVPIFMDNLEIDVLYSGSQKVLNAPPGISPISFSSRAITKVKSRKSKVQSYYLDALLLGNYWGCDDLAPKYHHTGPINLVYALREALSELAEETLEESWKRHSQNAKLLHQGLLNIGLIPFVQNPDYRLPTITTIAVPSEASDQAVAEFCAKKFSMELARGLPPLAGKVWRIGLMGLNSSPKNVKFALGVLKEAIQSTSQSKINSKF